MKRAASPLAAIVLACASATAAPAARPALGDIPEAAVPELPVLDQRPASIAAGSSVGDLRVNAGPNNGMPPPTHHGHFRGKRAAVPTPAASTQAEITGEKPENVCVSVLVNGRDAFRSSSMFLESYEGVMPVRIESVKEAGDRATLSIVDAWVDPATLGAKEIRRVEVPLRRLATGPLGSSVYAFRSKNVVNLVVPAGMNGQLNASDGRVVSASCAVARAELPAERGKGATLTGFFTRQTPAIEAKDGLAAVPPMTIRVGLSASSSQTSRDPDPVISVVLRALDEIPPNVRQRIPQAQIDE